MPSRKKEKGKARQEAKAEQLLRDNSSQSCAHGCPHKYKRCQKYLDALKYKLAQNMNMHHTRPFAAAWDAMTAIHAKYPDILTNEDSRQLVKNFVLANGTEVIIQKTQNWKQFAGSLTAVCHMIDYFTVFGRHDLRTLSEMPLKDIDAINGCERSIIHFYHRNIQCDCLKAKYTASKSLLHTAICFGCSQTKPKSCMFVCQGCKIQQVCSNECHLALWPDHKMLCKEINRMKANTRK